MIGQLPGIALLLALLVLFGWLAARARRLRPPLARWPATLLAGLLALVFAVLSVIALVGVYRLDAPVDRAVPDLKAATSSDQIARGKRLAHLCIGCHATSKNLPLDGAQQSFLPPALATLYPPNLTPAGPLARWSDGEVIRAIREGIDRGGHPLLIMPADVFHHLSDADAKAIVGYLRAQPAVPHATPPRSVSLLGTLLVGAGMFPTALQPPLAGPVAAPAAGATPAYGAYLVEISGCRTCHGEDLGGGKARQFGGPPVGPNLTQIVPRWTETQFVQTIRTGRDPNGYELRPDMMPWKELSAAFTDDELRAIYADIHSLAPVSR